MRKLLVATDFSANARHVAEYAYKFAKQIKAGIVLCNAVIIPAEVPQAGLVAWPTEGAELLFEDSSNELEKLKKHISKKSSIIMTLNPLLALKTGRGPLLMWCKAM